MKNVIYDDSFYSDRKANTEYAANCVLQLLFQQIGVPKSVTDVGCGTGTWLAQARRLGASLTVGFEGPWVETNMLDDPAIELRRVELESTSISTTEKFDLAMSLEVAEHLSAPRGTQLVNELCFISDTVLFSAAIPGQQGNGHINEQWQSYWAGIFRNNGFVASDIIRPAIWNDEKIPSWYRQNIIVYRRCAEGRKLGDATQLDIVHPAYYLRSKAYSLRERLHIASGIPKAALRRLGARL